MALKSRALQHRELCCSILIVAVHWATYKKQLSPRPMEWQIGVHSGGGRELRWRLLQRAEALDRISCRLVQKCLEFTQWSLSPETPQLCWNSIWDQRRDNNSGYWIRAAKSVLCTALASAVRHIIWEGLAGRTVVISDEVTEGRQNKRLDVIQATNGPQLFYISSMASHSIFCWCVLFTWTVCFSGADSFIYLFIYFEAFSLQRALRQPCEKRLLCCEGLCVVVKKLLYVLSNTREHKTNTQKAD